MKKLELKCHEELGFCCLFLSHISGVLKRSSWMDVDASKSGPLLLLSLCQSKTRRVSSLTLRAGHVVDKVTQSSLQEFKASRDG